MVALEAIHTVRSKRVAISDDVDDLSSVSESEAEDGESSHDRRKRLGVFFRSQAESGNMPGIERANDAEDPYNSENGSSRQRRRLFRSRKHAEARREKRINVPFGQHPETAANVNNIDDATPASNDVVLNVEQVEKSATNATSGNDGAEAVSYTHLTLPTILLV